MRVSSCLGSRACGTVPVDLIVIGRATLSITSVTYIQAAQRPFCCKDAITAKTETLMTVSQKLGEKMYADMQAKEAAAGGAAGGPGADAKPADDNVVDAEVKEVKKG